MLTFKPEAPGAGKERMMNILRANQHQAKFFSRVESHQELIAIVSDASHNHKNMFHWVWLSSKEDGAYTDGQMRYIEETAASLDRGGWNYQPNIQITLDHFKQKD